MRGESEWSVEQGPRWLADLFVTPPWWMVPVMVGLFVGSIAVAGYVLHRDGIDEEIQAEMLSNGLTATACLIGTVASVRLLRVPYVGDVLVGVLVGVAVATRAPAASRDFISEVRGTDVE